jgi:hypothetical protein
MMHLVSQGVCLNRRSATPCELFAQEPLAARPREPRASVSGTTLCQATLCTLLDIESLASPACMTRCCTYSHNRSRVIGHLWTANVETGTYQPSMPGSRHHMHSTSRLSSGPISFEPDIDVFHREVQTRQSGRRSTGEVKGIPARYLSHLPCRVLNFSGGSRGMGPRS